MKKTITIDTYVALGGDLTKLDFLITFSLHEGSIKSITFAEKTDIGDKYNVVFSDGQTKKCYGSHLDTTVDFELSSKYKS